MAKTAEEEMEDLMAEALSERDNPEEVEDDLEEEESDEEENTKESESKEELPEEEENENQDETDDDNNDSDSESEDEEEGGDDVNTFTPIEIDVNGTKVTIESQEDMMAYIQAGAKSFNKEPETHLEEKSIIEQGNLSAEDLKLVVEAKNGSKEALAKLARDNKIDLLSIDESDADNYKQETEYRQSTEVDRVADEIASDPVHLQAFQGVVKALPKDFVNMVTGDAETLSNFSRHVKEGLAQEIIPKAITSQMRNGGSFMDNYSKIGQAILEARSKAPEQKQQSREVSERAKELRKRAKSGGGNPKADKVIDNGDDVWKLSDEEFGKLDLSTLRP